MNILINLSSQLISEALYDLLRREQDGYQILVASDRNTFDKPVLIISGRMSFL